MTVRKDRDLLSLKLNPSAEAATVNHDAPIAQIVVQRPGVV